MEVNQTLHGVWPSPGLVHYIYILGGCCRLMEFCPLQNLLCVQVLRSPTLAALLHGTRAVGVSQCLRHGTRNRITELSEPIYSAHTLFGIITLGAILRASVMVSAVVYKLSITRLVIVKQRVQAGTVSTL